MKHYVLGIETSCDETAASVLEIDGDQGRVLSSAIYSQIEIHQEYGGVIPEIASRSHLVKITPIIDRALREANIHKEDLSAIFATSNPGLAGSLLVGFSFGKMLAQGLDIPFFPINHIHGHIFSACIQGDNSITPIPHHPVMALTASGGHTSAYIVNGIDAVTEIGKTRDDAAGEAFDKIAKLIGLSYPGGPIIEKLAQENNFKDVYQFPRTKLLKDNLFFSFSGLKTAVFYRLLKDGLVTEKGRPTELMTRNHQKDIASSLLVCITDIFVSFIKKALKAHPAKELWFVGGVACNKYIKRRLVDVFGKNLIVAFSEPEYSCDNAAMIAHVGMYEFLKAEQNGTLEDTERNLKSDIF